MDSLRVLFNDSTIDSKADISKIDHFSERLLFEIYVTEMYTVKPQSKANEFIFSKRLYGGLTKGISNLFLLPFDVDFPNFRV